MLSQSSRQAVYLAGFAGAVSLFLSVPAYSFAVEPTPSPTPTETVPVVINPSYAVVTIDDRQLLFILLPILLILVFTIANFVIRASAPYSLRRFKK